ncbi:MAG: protein kinase [Pyrinomonadaceae bacterium]
MPDERWQQIVEIFERAVDLPDAERASYLDEACRGDGEIRDEVEAMLRADEEAADFIESPIMAGHSLSITGALKLNGSPGTENLLGQRVGAFKLVRELGHGGMGAVYLAERADGEFKQYVAVKLIKRGMDSDFIVRRFRHERQILANLEHQNIARLFDGGTTPEGLPYFIMEFIEGETFYRYCDANKMDLAGRLEMFRQICSAVSYAHEKQIIHRDIKPNNILVTRYGVPKLLDFGIAKILDPELIHESVSPTASMMRLLTPDYASPEQIRGEEVTVAGDVYSLGILLYELLTGHRPFIFSKLSLHEVSRIVCEVFPEFPSKIVSRDENLLSLYTTGENGRTTDFAEARNMSVGQIKKELSRNLDNIIMKALAKEPSERYASAKEFSDDIYRHLRGEKIVAGEFVVRPREQSNGTGKREPAATGSKSLAVLPFKQLNVGNTGDTGEKFLGLGLADAITTRLSKIRRFIVRPTSSVMRYEEEMTDPIRVGEDLNVEYILDGHIKRASNRLRVTVQLLDVARNATVWATSIDETVGDLFSLEDAISTKVTEALLPHLSANELEQFSRRGTNDPEAYEHYLRGRYHFGSFTEESFARAIVCFHKAVAEDPEYAHAYTGIADYYNWLGIFGVLPPQECFQAAIEAASKAVELDDHLAEAHSSLGFSLHAGNYDWNQAEYHFLRSLELNPNYATTYTWLGILRFTEARFDEGLRYARRAIELDPFSPFNQHNLGWGLYYARRFDESIKQYRQLTRDFPQYGLGHYCLSKVLRFVGRFEESIEEIETANRIFEDSVFAGLGAAESYAAAGRHGEAKEILEKLRALSDNRYVSPYQMALVYCYLDDNKNAFDALERAIEVKEAWLNWFGVEPVFDRLRGDERYAGFIEKLGSIINFDYSPVGLRDASTNVSSTDRNTEETDIAAAAAPPEESSFQKRKTLVIESEGRDKKEAGGSKNGLRKRLSRWAVIGAVLIFGVLIFYWTGFLTVSFTTGDNIPAANSAAKSLTLVVLPFKSEDPTGENLGVGLADALTSKLGNIKKLSILSSNAGRAMAAENAREIGEKLGAGYILRGTLEEAGQIIKVRAELVNSADERAVWTEAFESADGDLFTIQSKIAERIWTSLKIDPLPLELQQISKSYTKSGAAYELYLIGRYQMINRSPENLRKAINTFSQARDQDPNFALAYVGLADAYALQNLYEIPPPADAYAKSKENAIKALSLDDSLAEAHASLAYVKFYHERDRAGAELEFRRSIQINPSYATAHHWFALVLAAMNNPMESISEANNASQLDPVSAVIKTATGMTYYFNRDYKEALEQCDRALGINSGFVPAHKVKRWIYQTTGNYDAAISSFLKERSLSGGEDIPEWFITQAQIEAIGPNRADALKKLDRAVTADSIKKNPAAYAFETALSYAAFGEKEKALDWLEKAEAAGSHSFNFLEVDPRLDSLHNEPRFTALVKKLQTPKFAQ